jgi:hypothetical protein
MDMLEARRELENSLQIGQPSPEASPNSLHIGAIFEKRALFQHRAPQKYASESHIKELAKAPLAGRPLDPITVFWTGQHYVLIDGHHRLAAYRKAAWKREVPIKVFKGTIDAAIGYAGKANSGAKLGMSRSEKQGLAWRLTCGTCLSRQNTVRASGVSDGIVAEMRRVRTRLTKEMGRSLNEVAQLSWWEAKQASSGDVQEVEQIDFDARLEQEAQELANKLVKSLGMHNHLRHETLARALEIYDKRLPDALREVWGPVDDEEWGLGPDPDEEVEINPEF